MVSIKKTIIGLGVLSLLSTNLFSSEIENWNVELGSIFVNTSDKKILKIQPLGEITGKDGQENFLEIKRTFGENIEI